MRADTADFPPAETSTHVNRDCYSTTHKNSAYLCLLAAECEAWCDKCARPWEEKCVQGGSCDGCSACKDIPCTKSHHAIATVHYHSLTSDRYYSMPQLVLFEPSTHLGREMHVEERLRWLRWVQRCLCPGIALIAPETTSNICNLSIFILCPKPPLHFVCVCH